jgi:hypothetical protein
MGEAAPLKELPIISRVEIVTVQVDSPALPDQLKALPVGLLTERILLLELLNSRLRSGTRLSRPVGIGACR